MCSSAISIAGICNDFIFLCIYKLMYQLPSLAKKSPHLLVNIYASYMLIFHIKQRMTQFVNKARKKKCFGLSIFEGNRVHSRLFYQYFQSNFRHFPWTIFKSMLIDREKI